MSGDKSGRTQSGDCQHCGDASEKALRCACGSLLARYVAGRLELKCRRCKRTVTVQVSPAPEDGAI
jgi:phage FluMu protein Com